MKNQVDMLGLLVLLVLMPLSGMLQPDVISPEKAVFGPGSCEHPGETSTGA